ncbi:hypothetical protein DER45DRAFT_583452 [Fusarium avenaceum]|nr:hypothetical protein DER45DRAFT_583452 [Fusarium avenaceum]
MVLQPSLNGRKTILASHGITNIPAAADAVSATHSSPSQQLQPLTPMSCVPVQPWLQPDVSWDTLLTSAQFLLPFSTVPSLEVGTLPDFCFGDTALAATGQSADHQSVQTGFGAEATERGAVEAIQVCIGPDNLTVEEEDVLIAENIPHVPPVTEETRACMIHAIKAGLPQHEAQELDANFPSLRHLDTYMQLYFEHFHPRMPLLHVPTFQASPETWQLVLSVLRELSSVNVLSCAQSHLLFQESLSLSGEWSITVEAQLYRNTLVTLCRLLLSREGTLMHTPASTEDANHAWLQWIQSEAKRRVVYFTYSDLEQLTKSAILLSASLQQAAESDLRRAMGLDSTGNPASQPSPALGLVTVLAQKAFDALSQVGCSQALRETDIGTSSNDFALLSRVLAILSFTPLSLLFTYSKWQTTDLGQSNARSELLNTISQNVSRARHCLYYAAQVIQHFRTTRPATVLDIMGLLVCVLYMVLYVDIIEQQDPHFGRPGAGVKASSMEIIRLDQVVDVNVLNAWLQKRRGSWQAGPLSRGWLR